MQRPKQYQHSLEILAEARDKTGINQRELSRQLKRPHTYISKVESGERRIDVIEFIEIARALEIDPTKLFSKVVQKTGL